MSKQRKCIVCGARVRNQNPRCNTCSPFCTEIKKGKKSRDQLVKEDSLNIQTGSLQRHEITGELVEDWGITAYSLETGANFRS